MNIAIFDTETTSLTKPFCYNIGYTIVTEQGQKICAKDFVIEQIWHNIPLFSTTYYENKRPLYISAMKARKTKLKKFGQVTQEMKRDFKNYEVEFAYAYNSQFDEKVFEFNCDWFKCINPFDTVSILDIRGNVHHAIAFTKEFQDFCEKNERFTDKGNYSTTAETIFQYITKDQNFEEAHTALADSLIEKEILFETFKLGCLIGVNYEPFNSIPRMVEKTLTIKFKEGEVDKECKFPYLKKIVRGDTIKLS